MYYSYTIVIYLRKLKKSIATLYALQCRGIEAYRYSQTIEQVIISNATEIIGKNERKNNN